MYQMDADFNVTAVHFVNVDSRGVVQNPADGQLYMKNYFNGSFYRLNTQ